MYQPVLAKTPDDKVQDIVRLVAGDPTSTINLKVTWEGLGKGKLKKVDADTGEPVSGVVLGVYTDKACTDRIQRLTTNGKGLAETDELEPDTYYVKEITASDGYIRSDKVYTLKIKAGETTTVEISNQEQLCELTIYKKGKALSSWDGTNFVYTTEKLPGATFKVTAGGNIYKADGTKVYDKGDTVKGKAVTGEDGSVTLKSLHHGTYIVTETKTIDGYTINTEPKTVTLSYGGQTAEVVTESVTITNTRQTAKVKAVKQDSKTGNGLSGGEYSLYAGNDIKNHAGSVIMKKDTLIQTAATGADGIAAYTVGLPGGNTYYIKETKAPEGYIRNTTAVYKFTFDDLKDTEETASFSYTFKNDYATGKIMLTKVDAETGAKPQGDASLIGAVYGLYAKEDIVHPDQKTGVLYKKDTLVSKLTTDGLGKSEKAGLYQGRYYLKELTPSPGYLLDPTIYDADLSYAGDTVSVVTKQVTSKEQVKKQAFSLIKVEDAGESELPTLEKAGFTAYLKSSLLKHADGTYDFINATPVILTKDGKTELFTDSRGYAESRPLPYGEYVVTESTVPHNHEPIKDFIVKITEDSTTPQVWRIFSDKAFMAKLKIVKKDDSTGQTVLKPNAEFKIFNKDTGKYVVQYTTYPSKVEHTSFKTDESGTLTLPERLKYGHYRIEEIHAPDGYIVNPQKVDVDISEDMAYLTDPDTGDVIITVEFKDSPVTGEITIEKKGEVPAGYKGGLFDLFTSSGDKEFLWKEISLAGAEFDVKAAEDIYTQDNQVDEDGNRTKLFSKGDLAGTLRTGEDGKATLSKLPEGTYEVKETKAPEGFVLDQESHFVTISYQGETVPVVYESLTVTNKRQRAELFVLKQDGETKLPIAGAEFGLYTGEDITDTAGNVLVEKDTLLETAVSDTDGRVRFEKDIPFGSYYAKELKAPDGYTSTDETIPFEFTYQGQETNVVELTKECDNTPTMAEIMKTDITSGAELSGATLSIIDKDGTVIDTWTSEAGNPHKIAKLTVGETYTLREDYAPYGYLKAQDVEFTVEDTGEVQLVQMKDEVPTGTIVVNKDGELLDSAQQAEGRWYDFIFKYLKKSLAGVTFEAYAAEDILSPDGLDAIKYREDQLVGTIVTNDRGVGSLEKLPAGRYYLIETKTLNGFELNDTPILVDLRYVDQETEVIYAGMNVTNERQHIQVIVQKKDAETKEALAGAVFGLYTKGDIKNADGKVILKEGTLIEKRVSGKDGYCFFESDLPRGTYQVKEIEPPKGYASTDQAYEFTHDGKDQVPGTMTYETVFENDRIKTQFTKTDITGKKEIPGAKLSILDGKGKTVDSWISGRKPHKIEKLPAGTYTLREETAPLGYAVSRDVTFTVEDTGKLQKVSMKDEETKGRIRIKKTEEGTGKALAGAEFEFRDENGKVLETLVTDENGVAESKEYPVGIYQKEEYVRPLCYTLAEVKAPEGHILDGREIEIQFPADTGKKLVTVKKDVANKPTEEKLPQTGEFPFWIPFVGIGMLLSGGSAAIWAYHRKKEGRDGKSRKDKKH